MVLVGVQVEAYTDQASASSKLQVTRVSGGAMQKNLQH